MKLSICNSVPSKSDIAGFSSLDFVSVGDAVVEPAVIAIPKPHKSSYAGGSVDYGTLHFKGVVGNITTTDPFTGVWLTEVKVYVTGVPVSVGRAGPELRYERDDVEVTKIGNTSTISGGTWKPIGASVTQVDGTFTIRNEKGEPLYTSVDTINWSTYTDHGTESYAEASGMSNGGHMRGFNPEEAPQDKKDTVAPELLSKRLRDW